MGKSNRLPRHSSCPLPLWLKAAAGAYLAILLPVYQQCYGWANFLWFSDISLFLTTTALWLQSRLLASVAAVGSLIPEIAWNVDFFTGLLTGRRPIGLSGYMWDQNLPKSVRALSLFHVPLVPLLLWLVHRLGYDRRALPVQTALTWVLLPVSRAVSSPKKNINWVYGLGSKPQHCLPPRLYLLLLMLGVPLLIYWPTHAALRRWKG